MQGNEGNSQAQLLGHGWFRLEEHDDGHSYQQEGTHQHLLLLQVVQPLCCRFLYPVNDTQGQRRQIEERVDSKEDPEVRLELTKDFQHEIPPGAHVGACDCCLHRPEGLWHNRLWMQQESS